jgi:hypothetical protein
MIAAPAWGHSGRLFGIEVVDGQLAARGYNWGPADGVVGAEGPRRPYYNAVHDHWVNSSGIAMATFPTFDIYNPPGPLIGENVSITLTGARRWVDPPRATAMLPPGTLPLWESLLPAEMITLGYGGSTVNTHDLGSFVLTPSVPGGENVHWFHPEDEDGLSYAIDLEPSNVIYVLELQLSTSAAGIAPSETIYSILSPQGADPAEKLHYASLFLERHLGTAIPEPSSLLLLSIGGCLLGRRCRGTMINLVPNSP